MKINNPNKLYELKNGPKVTILMYASYRGNIRIMKMMIKNFKADLEKKDKDGWTCFFFACFE